MRDQEPSGGILNLLGQKITYRVVQFLAARTGATAAEIAEAVGADAGRVLRSLALEGFVARDGTWDLPADKHTTFALTPRGRELVDHLERLDQWARARRARHRCS